MTVKMTRQEFQDIVHEIAGGPVKEGRGKKAVFHDRAELQEEWTAGGRTGGNCWDDYDDTRWESVTADPEPTFTELDDILLKVCPNIGLLQYRKVEQLIEYDSHHQNEYYGNYYIKTTKTIKIDDLWYCLIDVGVIDET